MLLDGSKSIKDIKAQPAENLAVVQCNTCIKQFFTGLSRNIFRQMCIYKNHPSCKVWSRVTECDTQDIPVESFLLLTDFNLNFLCLRTKPPFKLWKSNMIFHLTSKNQFFHPDHFLRNGRDSLQVIKAQSLCKDQFQMLCPLGGELAKCFTGELFIHFSTKSSLLAQHTA